MCHCDRYGCLYDVSVNEGNTENIAEMRSALCYNKEDRMEAVFMIHILVVDDDEKLNKTICTWLNDCGFETKGVLGAKEAYDELYNSLYDLIVSDIMMPEVDGFEFARNVREVNKHMSIHGNSFHRQLRRRPKSMRR